MDARTNNIYRKYFWDRRNLYNDLVGSEFFEQIEKAYQAIDRSLKSGGKILIFGNGGSAAEAQHFDAELVCKFEKKRKALPAIALTTNSSVLTAQSNDFGFDFVFSRLIEALGKPGDIAVGLTTSDAKVTFRGGQKKSHSMNIFYGLKAARGKNIITIGLVSQKTKRLLSLIDFPIIIPHENTAVIQEVHLSIIHLLCKKVEEGL